VSCVELARGAAILGDDTPTPGAASELYA